MGSKHRIIIRKDIWHIFLVGFFDGASCRRNCGCGAYIVIEPGNCYRFWWEGGQGTNNKAEIVALWGVLIAAKWLGLESIQIYGDAKSIIDWGKGHNHVNPPILNNWMKRIRTLGYAMTETTGVGASADSEEESRHHGSVGMLAPNTEAKIVDPESGAPLPPNKRGELWLRGQFVMKGYFNNPEATASALDVHGWLRTGDLCYIDDEGYLFVVDRLKELIKYKGYQVAPAELEALLLSHPEIAEAAVIPFPDKEAGQVPMAYIVQKPGKTLSETSVIDFVAQQVAPYKKVRRVAFVSKIPKTAAGKILRKDLIKLSTSKL